MKIPRTSIMTALVIAPTAVPTAAVTRPIELIACCARSLRSSGVALMPSCCAQPPTRITCASTMVRIACAWAARLDPVR